MTHLDVIFGSFPYKGTIMEIMPHTTQIYDQPVEGCANADVSRA
jgi:hypothetical protein